MEFTEEQSAAIRRSGKNILVSAGAGSGKTQVLTQRVLHFVKNEGYKLDEFLILTFTKLAAAEMKDRIRNALKTEGLEAAEEVDAASICTFDAYALSLVKKYHFLLKVSPDVANIDSTIIDVRKRTLINEVFEEYYVRKDPRFIKMIDDFCYRDDNDIKKLVLDTYNKALLELDTEEFLKGFVDYYYSDALIETMYRKVEDKLIKSKNALMEIVPNLSPSIIKKEDVSYKKKASFVLSGLKKASAYQDIVKEMLSIDELGIPKSCKSLSDEESKTLALFHKTFGSLKDFVCSIPEDKASFKASMLKTKESAEVVVEILFELDTRIRAYKERKNAYEFQDIAKMALSLVRDHKDIQSLIKSKLKMIMIDEYQDTSALQDSFISYISNNNVYQVGDVKQSIYRFRNADVGIFIDKYNKYKANDSESVIDMNTNFRSRPEILDGINHIFSQIMTEKRGGADYKTSHMIESGNKLYIQAGLNPDQSPISYLVYERGINSNDYLEEEAHVIARDIIAKINSGFKVMDIKKDKDGNPLPYLRDCRFTDFCILMDRGGAFEKYARIFSDYKLPLYVENDDDITANDMTLVMINVLRLIKAVRDGDYSSPMFEKALASVARSYLYGYDDQALYEMYKKRNLKTEPIVLEFADIVSSNKSLPTYELFEKACYSLDFYHKCVIIGDVEKNEKYLDYFIETFKTMSRLDYSIDDFISFMENVSQYKLKLKLSSTGSSLDSVTIMNYHKSKGLEFNIVYYSGLKKQFNRMDSKDKFGFSKKYGLITLPAEVGKAPIIKQLNAESELEEDMSERIRQFYVALTRTREQAIIIYPKDKDTAYLFPKETEDGAEAENLPEEETQEESNNPLGVDFDGFSNFLQIVSLFVGYEKFKKYTVDASSDKPTLTNPPKSVEHRNFEIKTHEISVKPLDTYRPSKKLDIDVSKGSLDFGTKMHFLMEITDFNNPDYSSMDEHEKKAVKAFLSSHIMKDASKGEAYKEYEFYDPLTSVSGIIDLMMVYDDHIDIIDYKTKHIDDESYDKQVQTYMSIAANLFNKPVKGYLYSLETGDIREVASGE